MILTILVALMMSAFRKAQADESVMIPLRSLCTEVRGRGILGSSYPRSCIAPFLKGYKQLIASVRDLTFNPTSCGAA
jgi:hypothetical protein